MGLEFFSVKSAQVMPHPFFPGLHASDATLQGCFVCAAAAALDVFLQREIVNTPTCELYLLDLLVAVH